MELLEFQKRGQSNSIKVEPRRPFSTVAVSQTAFSKLQTAQAVLGKNIQLVLVRGFESQNPALRTIRMLNRKIGQALFCVFYPKRGEERSQIFSANGHDLDGNHIDVGIEIDGTRLCLLPFGVFTPMKLVRQTETKYAPALSKVRSALADAGFTIHSNPVEGLQIHCDLNPNLS